MPRSSAPQGFDSSSTGAADAIPTAPIIFTKVPQSVIGPDEPIRYPTGVSEQLDYEAELAVDHRPGRRAASPRPTRWSTSGATRSSTT